MTDTLRTFAEQVTTVAREVGIEGKLGGQAKVPGAAGTWRDLTDNVNMLAGNLTNQVRNIALVTTAVANGDLSQKITVDAQGRDPRAQEHHQRDGRSAAHLRRARSRASRARSAPRASSAARRKVPGVAGTWQDLTENVNLMAVEPDQPGARHRQGRDRGRRRRPVPEAGGRGARARSPRSPTRSTT